MVSAYTRTRTVFRVYITSTCTTNNNGSEQKEKLYKTTIEYINFIYHMTSNVHVKYRHKNMQFL